MSVDEFFSGYPSWVCQTKPNGSMAVTGRMLPSRDMIMVITVVCKVPGVGGGKKSDQSRAWRLDSCTIDLGQTEKLQLPVSSQLYGSPEIAHAALRVHALEAIRQYGRREPEDEILWRLQQSDDQIACQSEHIHPARFEMNDSIYHCPHCHTAVIVERASIHAKRPDDSHAAPRPEWHCNQCGTTFAPDYFDLTL